MGRAVGIDLGTTNTVVAAVRDGVVSTLADRSGARLLPSVVSFHPSGSVLVGRGAVERRLLDARNTIYSVKRLIGRPWSAEEVQDARTKFSFELRESTQGGTQAVARGQGYALPEISAFVLRQAKALAEEALGEPVDRAVITVPANFNDLQRGATKTAGRLADLEVLRILNEPTAAALAYGQTGQAHERVAVYDLGGGTFDVTLLDLAGNVFEVLATAGDSALGGDDIDVVIAERMADELLKKHRFDARTNAAAFARLRLVAEQVKRELSERDESAVTLDDLVPGERGATTRWAFRMTRPELEWASLPIVERTFQVCQTALESAGIGPTELDRVILVGGSTRMPLVARKVEQFFQRQPVVRINPDEVVALGAAIQAGLLDRTRGRSAEAAEAPRVDDSSIVAPAPPEGTGGPEIPELPIVQGRPPTPLLPAREERIARPFDPREDPTPAREPPPAPSPAPPPARKPPRDATAPMQFLPGAKAKPLVFDPPPRAAVAAPSPATGAAARQPTFSPGSIAGPPPIGPATGSVAGQSPLAQATGRGGAVAGGPAPAGRAIDRSEIPANLIAPAPPRRNPLLIDVTPLSLSVETVGGFCDSLIEANTPVPCDRTRTFATASEGQTSVRVRVAQGESRKFDENTFLGEVELTGITAAARGQAPIDVTFEIDADGILNVRARDGASGREIAARIQLVGARTDAADIEAMKARQAAMPLATARS